MFEVYLEDEGLALRGSFVINPQGKIVAYEVNDNSIGREASELLRKVQGHSLWLNMATRFALPNGGPGLRLSNPALTWLRKFKFSL